MCFDGPAAAAAAAQATNTVWNAYRDLTMHYTLFVDLTLRCVRFIILSQNKAANSIFASYSSLHLMMMTMMRNLCSRLSMCDAFIIVRESLLYGWLWCRPYKM